MSGPVRGDSYERELENRLWNEGWASFRVAGSGTVGHESADIIAMKDGRILVFEVKSYNPDSSNIMLSDDSAQLKEIRSRANDGVPHGPGEDVVECWFALREKGSKVWKALRANRTMLSTDEELTWLIDVLKGDV